MRRIIPLIMWGVLFTGLIMLWGVRSIREIGVWRYHPFDGDLVPICLYLIWMLAELPIARSDARSKGHKNSDHGTCLIYGCGQALTMFAALWFPSHWNLPNGVQFLGFFLLLAGGGCRLWAVRSLGRFYSHTVRTEARHQIVATGPYRYIRHPAYAGMLLVHLGICVYFFNWVALGAFLLLLLPSILWRIRIEESVLISIEGYAQYAEKRKRLFPAIW